MNLVAKEFVASRDDAEGVLILSSFTGAARELSEALIVNPYDTRATGDAIQHALSMPKAEQRARMRLMRDYSGLWLLAFKPFFSRRPGATLM